MQKRKKNPKQTRKRKKKNKVKNSFNTFNRSSFPLNMKNIYKSILKASVTQWREKKEVNFSPKGNTNSQYQPP